MIGTLKNQMIKGGLTEQTEMRLQKCLEKKNDCIENYLIAGLRSPVSGLRSVNIFALSKIKGLKDFDGLKVVIILTRRIKHLYSSFLLFLQL